MSGPIRPEDIKPRPIPLQVFEIFNGLIQQKWDGSRAIVRQDDVVRQLVDAGFDREQIFDEHMLDVEDYYRAQGWSVAYDSPAYNETYPATFTFSKKL